jgi:hypothetical protein
MPGNAFSLHAQEVPMNMRKIATAVLMLSLITTLSLIGVSDYLSRPAFANGQTPPPKAVYETFPKGVPAQQANGAILNVGVPARAIPIFATDGSSIEANTKNQVARLQELMIELDRRKNDLRQKEAEIARQQKLLDHLQKQRDDLAENAAIVSKEMARVLATCKDQIERFETASKETNIPPPPGIPPVIPIPQNDDGAAADKILQKFEAIEKRLENIEKHMPPSGRGN